VAEIVDGGTVLTLAELFEQPAGMAAYQVLPAITMYCTPSTEADAEDPVPPDEVSTDTVRLGFGWRGPYLRLTPGNLLPRDGWGGELVTPVGVVPGFPNNCLLNGILPVAAGDPIDQIISYGRDGATGGADAYDADLGVAFPSSLLTGTVHIQVEVRTADGNFAPIPVPHLSGDPIGKIFVRLFEPEPNSASGLIRVQAAQGPVPAPPPPIDYFNTYNTHNASTLTFAPVTTMCGPRVVRAYYLRGSGDPRPTNAAGRSPPKHLMVRPGQNFVTIVLTVPNSLP
jgi:hypothetical protein